MESQYLQNVRYKLQKRVRRLNGADLDQFYVLIKQFMVFIDESPLLASVVAQLLSRVPNYEESVDSIFNLTYLNGATEAESAAIGYGVLCRYAKQSQPYDLCRLIESDNRNQLGAFRAAYLEPFYEYVDEHLDDRSFTLHALLRYKHSCEWFRRQRLYDRWSTQTLHGEKVLALDMYEYLYEQGVSFHIEPASASGEADMVSVQTSSEPLIADAKVFNPDRSHGKPYIVQGFHQVYHYTCDYNEPIGFLIIFNTSPRPLRFLLANASDSIPRVVYNHKTVFLVVIDIFPHSEPASKRKVGDAVDITEEDFVGSLGPVEAVGGENSGGNCVRVDETSAS